MARASLDDNAPYADAALHAGDGLTALQFRRTPGALTEHIVAPITFANRIRFERSGSRFRFLASRAGGSPVEMAVEGVALGETALVGLFLCSHHADTIDRAEFRGVRLETRG